MKKITVTKPFFAEKDEFKNYVDQIWENQWYTNKGPLLRRFQRHVSTYLKADNLALMVNGHMALDIAIKANKTDFGKSSLGGGVYEVITTPFTFVSTIHAITLNHLKPVFCDIDPNNLTLDVMQLEKLISDRTIAILPVHVYGHICNLEEIEKIANKYDLKVIYDAAHAFGVKYKGKSLVTYGDFSMLSFHATKLLHTIEGGALIYQDNKFSKMIEGLVNFGIESEVEIPFIGENAKMNEFQAAMGLTNLPYVEQMIDERKKIVSLYESELQAIDGVHFYRPYLNKDVVHNYSYMPILLRSSFGCSRDELYYKLKEKNIFSRRYFYPIITKLECYKSQYENIQLPVAEYIAERILCLPIYNGLKLEQVKAICECIKVIRREFTCQE